VEAVGVLVGTFAIAVVVGVENKSFILFMIVIQNKIFPALDG